MIEKLGPTDLQMSNGHSELNLLYGVRKYDFFYGIFFYRLPYARTGIYYWVTLRQKKLFHKPSIKITRTKFRTLLIVPEKCQEL